MSGASINIDKINILDLLKKLYRNEKYYLVEHPRILNLRNKLKKQNKNELLMLLDKVINRSSEKYNLVYEHGDFAPWNIVDNQGDFQLFDFEYFIKDGLEYMDMIKYYYQVGDLLLKLDFNNLNFMIKSKIKHKDSEILYIVFLISEISKKSEENINTEKSNNILGELVYCNSAH